MDPEVIRTSQLAQMLIRTESSIRSAIRDGAKWLPPYFRQKSQAGPVGNRQRCGPLIKANADGRAQ